MSKDAVNILLIEDREDEADIIRILFSRSRELQATIQHASSVAEALEQLAQYRFDIALLDLGLPDNVGVEAVSRIQEASPQTPIFVLTGDERRETGLAAIEAGAQDYLPKQHMVGRLLSQMTEHCIARQRRLQTLQRHSMVDELTGLQNRRGCDQAFIDSIRTRTNAGDCFAVGLLDIDNFKHVNDHWGHACGDDVIKAVGAALSTSLGDEGVVYRYGGEEFVALIWADNLHQLGQTMHRLRLECSKITVENQDHRITISSGATIVQRDETKREVFERADAALYVSKEGGRNACSFHDGVEIKEIELANPPMPRITMAKPNSLEMVSR